MLKIILPGIFSSIVCVVITITSKMKLFEPDQPINKHVAFTDNAECIYHEKAQFKLLTVVEICNEIIRQLR